MRPATAYGPHCLTADGSATAPRSIASSTTGFGRGAGRGATGPARRRSRPATSAVTAAAGSADRRDHLAVSAADLVGRGGRLLELALDAVDELAQQLVGDVLHHAPAELRRLAGDREVGVDLDLGPVAGRGELEVTVAPAVPLPRLSLPLASITARRAEASRSTKVPEPAYIRAIGPSLTLTVPEKPSSETR